MPLQVNFLQIQVPVDAYSVYELGSDSDSDNESVSSEEEMEKIETAIKKIKKEGYDINSLNAEAYLEQLILNGVRLSPLQKLYLAELPQEALSDAAEDRVYKLVSASETRTKHIYLAAEIPFLERMAKQDHLFALCALGEIYANGQDGVAVDLGKAEEYYRAAHKKKYPPAAFQLAKMYEAADNALIDKHHGQELDYDEWDEHFKLKIKAELYYGKAVDWNYSPAQEAVGLRYEKEQNYGTARCFYERAADNNLPSAQRRLAECYEWGNGVKQDPVRALIHYRQASVDGDVIATAHLGDLYADNVGDFYADNVSRAKELYQKAADKGNTYAQYQLTRLKNQQQAVDPARNELAIVPATTLRSWELVKQLATKPMNVQPEEKQHRVAFLRRTI